MTKENILIVGGGIGGLMTAIALNRKGIQSTIYEKAISFDANGAGLALWANAYLCGVLYSNCIFTQHLKTNTCNLLPAQTFP